MNLSSGNAGSTQLSPQDTRITRARESRDAAKILGAVYHGPIGDDLEILYTVPLLRKLSAVIRSVAPEVVLTHSPQDYMEDHMNTSRLAVTAAFARGMPTSCRPTDRSGGQPRHRLSCPAPWPARWIEAAGPGRSLCRHHLGARPERAALAAHRSQKEWLDTSQGMDSTWWRWMNSPPKSPG
ncbi:MAG: PIG-L family deacetylase [Verrucomicrobiales bacterium]